jgi:hypothetical protein
MDRFITLDDEEAQVDYEMSCKKLYLSACDARNVLPFTFIHSLSEQITSEWKKAIKRKGQFPLVNCIDLQ